jgi:hypothetical protein
LPATSRMVNSLLPPLARTPLASKVPTSWAAG